MNNRIRDKKIVITSGPTFEYFDPIRFISNHSSGKQGLAIAKKLAKYCDNVTLVTTIAYDEKELGNIKQINVKTAVEMHDATMNELPVDIAICVAAITDWRPALTHKHKIKKIRGQDELSIKLVKNPDILAALAQNYEKRPDLVIGFAAETENIPFNAKQKLVSKECDWLLTCDASQRGRGFGSDVNQIYFLDKDLNSELWEEMPKSEIAKNLAAKILKFYSK